jgi:simple sugar transport system permease protein
MTEVNERTDVLPTIRRETPSLRLPPYLVDLLVWVGMGLVAGALVTLAAGHSPLAVYRALFVEAFLTHRGLMIALQRATPLVLTAVAAAVAFRGGAINTGLAGQFMVGSAVAAVAGYGLPPLPPPLGATLALLFCGAGGAAAAFIPAAFRRLSGVNEVITGMIANFLIPPLLAAILNALPFLRVARAGAAREGVRAWTRLPQFAELTGGGWGAGTKAHVGIFVALALVLVMTWVMRRTTLGYEIRVTRANASFAEFAGVRAGRVFFLSMMLSGAVAAMAGGVEILGVWRTYRLGTRVVGDNGLVLALVGGQSFWGTALAALVYGGLESGAMNLSWTTPIPRPLIDILVQLLVLFAAVPSMRAFFAGTTTSDLERLGGRFVPRR